MSRPGADLESLKVQRLALDVMERREQQLSKASKLPLWIIEYIWAHKMADVLEDVEPSAWPDLDSQPLSLEDCGRLRVVSAKVYSIVKNRDVELFERVLTFLEETHRLLPRLVAPLKHMKIAFGLKTLIIMWMLKQKREMIDIIFKVNLFFPSRLPQYQNQCSQHELFLMKKNHMDFKALAQELAMDKGKLEHYATNQMQQQYGERYAQKVEDRLLQYLQKLETVLPGDAYIDKIMKKDSPVNEEEKLLLDVVSSDSATIATTLKRLLHCEVAFQDLGEELSEHPAKAARLSPSPPRAASSGTNLSDQAGLQPEGGEGPADPAVLVESPVLLGGEQGFRPQPKGDGGVAEGVEESCEELNQGSGEASSSPQFCSKHQRWVKSILQECPEERPDDPRRRAHVSASPPLFQSSSSRTSSQDLTPSDLTRPPSHPPGAPHTPEKTPEMASSAGHMTSGASPLDACPSPSLLRRQPSELSAGVPLTDVGSDLSPEPHRSCPRRNREASASRPRALRSPRCQSPRKRDRLQGAPSDPPQKTSETGDGEDGAATSVVKDPTRDAATSPRQPQAGSGGARIPPSAKASQQSVPVCPVQPRPPTPVQRRPPTPDGAASRPLPRLSLPSQAVLLRSRLLQPWVSLSRLSSPRCHRATDGRSRSRDEEGEAGRSSREEGRGGGEEGEEDSPFDLNLLYSSHSSSSGGEDSALLDPDYKPCIKKKRLVLEYEAARTIKSGSAPKLDQD